MVKIFVTLDCNRCGQPFNRIAVTTDLDPMNWKALAQDLEYRAENRGWASSRAAHYCDYCANDAMYKIESNAVPHDDDRGKREANDDEDF